MALGLPAGAKPQSSWARQPLSWRWGGERRALRRRAPGRVVALGQPQALALDRAITGRTRCRAGLRAVGQALSAGRSGHDGRRSATSGDHRRGQPEPRGIEFVTIVLFHHEWHGQRWVLVGDSFVTGEATRRCALNEILAAPPSTPQPLHPGDVHLR
jgi:hypothetical protein